ncbi:hypothetical protein CTAYLR_002362 [Chrysophaeum taylorii]|uniref:Transmembrane protein 19 n=1 Tax=Chrysophaeum taylorii TaxID=2483200 RepID=A0AAD7UI70_9STRA|nr:hypothetical protein CTAYLR_002362 [Chrysophaeum taylorii]
MLHLPRLTHLAWGVLLGVVFARRGIRKKSLSPSGGAAALVVAVLTFSGGPRFGLTLIAFYQSSSWLTRLGAARKIRLDENNTHGGERNAAQVLSCSAVAAALAVASRLFCGDDGARGDLAFAYVGFVATCAGDTWASEVGSLATGDPVLVTAPWRAVPPCTNGGLTLLGTAASAAGGLFIGGVHGILGLVFAPGGEHEIVVLALLGLATGLLGSLLDSLLGATCQITRYDPDERRVVKTKGIVVCGRDLLSNHAVNFISATATTALSPFLATKIAAGLGR